jgi:hypothetical protein
VRQYSRVNGFQCCCLGGLISDAHTAGITRRGKFCSATKMVLDRNSVDQSIDFGDRRHLTFVMIVLLFLVTQAMTLGMVELVRAALAAVAPRIRTPLVALAAQTAFRLVILFTIMMTATGATILLALGGYLATLPSYVGVAFWSFCVLCSTLVVNRALLRREQDHSSPRTEVKLISTNPAVLTVGLAASLFATTVMFRNADEFADWSRQYPITFLDFDIMAIIVVLIIMIPPILVWAFGVHLLVLLWLRLKAWVVGRRPS